MKNWKTTITKASVTAAALMLGVSSLAAPAMAGWGLSDLDPTNKNSGREIDLRKN